DPPVMLGELLALDPLQSAPRGQSGELADRGPPPQHRAGLRLEPRALAVRARPQRHVLLDLLARVVRIGLAVAPLQAGDDALELGGVGAATAEPVAIGDLDVLAIGAVEE